MRKKALDASVICGKMKKKEADMIQFTFLGTCAADFSPRLTGDCKNRFDRDARRASCALINGRYLLDCGPHCPDSLRIAGIDPGGKRARKTTPEDYAYYDYLIGMDNANIRNMTRIYGGDPEGKVQLLLDWCGRYGQEVADPWYTDDFDATWKDVTEGCAGLLDALSMQ